MFADLSILFCDISLIDYFSYSTLFFLFVLVAPSVSVRNVTYEQDDVNRKVACFPIGNPSIYTYHNWQHKSKYGVLIREMDGEQGGVLTLPGIPVENRYQDSGEYICTVGNSIVDRDGNVKQTGSGYIIINGM